MTISKVADRLAHTHTHTPTPTHDVYSLNPFIGMSPGAVATRKNLKTLRTTRLLFSPVQSATCRTGLTSDGGHVPSRGRVCRLQGPINAQPGNAGISVGPRRLGDLLTWVFRMGDWLIRLRFKFGTPSCTPATSCYRSYSIPCIRAWAQRSRPKVSNCRKGTGPLHWPGFIHFSIHRSLVHVLLFGANS